IQQPFEWRRGFPDVDDLPDRLVFLARHIGDVHRPRLTRRKAVWPAADYAIKLAAKLVDLGIGQNPIADETAVAIKLAHLLFRQHSLSISRRTEQPSVARSKFRRRQRFGAV